MFSLLALSLFLVTACSSFEKEQLMGSWQNELIFVKFNPDETMELKLGGDNVQKGSYHIFGNTIELINAEGKVSLNMSVVKIENDSLYINMMKTGSDNIKALARVKE